MSGLLDWMYKLASDLGSELMNVLPHSPFRQFINDFVPPQYLSWLNWFIPVSQILSILTLWLTAIAAFYIYSVAMRWVKMLSD